VATLARGHLRPDPGSNVDARQLECRAEVVLQLAGVGAGSLKGPQHGNPTSNLQMAADRAGPYSLRRPLVLAILAIAARRRRAARRARAASRPYDRVEAVKKSIWIGRMGCPCARREIRSVSCRTVEMP